MKKQEWFESWFDTSYYHTLYSNRDENEAKEFIVNLVEFLKIDPKSKVLDLACGKGRHSLTLNELGFETLGVDLSPNSISIANESKKESLSFEVHDKREVIEGRSFNAIFNLFTSFGYFEDLKDNDKVLNSISKMLLDDGLLVIDFMNAERIISNLVEKETKTVADITFNISRRFDGTHIFKNIQFEADDKCHNYTERVQAIKLEHFEKLLSDNQFEILTKFGDFKLGPFDAKTSDRLIIVAKKKK